MYNLPYCIRLTFVYNFFGFYCVTNNFIYVILNPSFANASINIQDTISLINQVENKDGNQIKVVIITDATTEGIDFKNIREGFHGYPCDAVFGCF